MSVSPAILSTHLDYTAWATARLLDAAAKLQPEELTRDFETADKSVLGTLAHVFAADRVWLARIKGDPPAAFITPEDYDFAMLQREWPALYRRWNEWVHGLTEEAAGAQLAYSDMKGRKWEMEVSKIVLHVVNHGTHHRGQVSGFLRTMKYTPPSIDLIHYYREKP